MSGAELDDCGYVVNVDRQCDHPATKGSGIVKYGDALCEKGLTTNSELTAKVGEGKLRTKRLEAGQGLLDLFLCQGGGLKDIVVRDASGHIEANPALKAEEGRKKKNKCATEASCVRRMVRQDK